MELETNVHFVIKVKKIGYFVKTFEYMLGMLVCAYIPSTQETEVGGSL